MSAHLNIYSDELNRVLSQSPYPNTEATLVWLTLGARHGSRMLLRAHAHRRSQRIVLHILPRQMALYSGLPVLNDPRLPQLPLTASTALRYPRLPLVVFYIVFLFVYVRSVCFDCDVILSCQFM
jgi:hypothetical protein